MYLSTARRPQNAAKQRSNQQDHFGSKMLFFIPWGLVGRVPALTCGTVFGGPVELWDSGLDTCTCLYMFAYTPPRGIVVWGDESTAI